jgi:hypothetical protein
LHNSLFLLPAGQKPGITGKLSKGLPGKISNLFDPNK